MLCIKINIKSIIGLNIKTKTILQIMVYLYNGMLFINLKESTIDTHNINISQI